MIPSEAQMRQAIAQTLSLPFAYNSPVMVLDFDLGDKDTDKITGRFKDLSRPRVFSFEITKKSVVYKPFVARIDSTGLNVEAWRTFQKVIPIEQIAKAQGREKPSALSLRPTIVGVFVSISIKTVELTLMMISLRNGSISYSS